MSEENKLCVGVILAIVLSFIFGMMTGDDNRQTYLRSEAIKAGVARWTSDESGNPKFEFVKP